MKTLTNGSTICVALCALWVAPLWAQPTSAPSGLGVTSREHRYELDAGDLSEVIALLNEMRLEGESGPFSQGLTDYSVTPEWQLKPTGAGCRLANVTVDVDITMTLPRWTSSGEAPESEQRRWVQILSRITRHEYRHKDITIEVATELANRLERLEANTCTGARRAAESALVLAESTLAERHAAFDARDQGGGRRDASEDE